MASSGPAKRKSLPAAKRNSARQNAPAFDAGVFFYVNVSRIIYVMSTKSIHHQLLGSDADKKRRRWRPHVLPRLVLGAKTSSATRAVATVASRATGAAAVETAAALKGETRDLLLGPGAAIRARYVLGLGQRTQFLKAFSATGAGKIVNGHGFHVPKK